MLMNDASEAETLCGMLREVEFAVEMCRTVDELRRRFEHELGLAIVDEECFRPPEVHRLVGAISAQPPWSDLPLIVVTDSAAAAETRFAAMRSIDPLGNTVMVERPIRADTLISLTHFALRARRRQYELRDRVLELGGREAALREHKSRLENSIKALLESKWREAARAAELEAVMEAVPAAVWIAHDRHCQRITGSRYSYEVLRIPYGTNASRTAREAVGTSEFRLMRDGVELQSDDLPLQRAARTGLEVRDASLDVAFNDGSVRNLFGHAAPLRDENGELSGAVAAFVDITEQRRVQMQLQSLNETLEQRISERTATAENRASRLRQAASQLAQAEHRERRRLAQMLHDHLQQILVACRLKLASARRKLANEPIAASLGDVDELLNESIDASRSLTAELSPPILYEGGLCAALEWLGRQKEKKYGLHVDVTANPDSEPADEETRVLLFQIVRELLFNVVKHGQTDRARVKMSRQRNGDSDLVAIEVRDDGAGFDPKSLDKPDAANPGFGLLSIRERLSVVGGRLQISSEPDRGAALEVTVPASTTELISSGDRLHGMVSFRGSPKSPQVQRPGQDIDGKHMAESPSGLEGEELGETEQIRILLVDDNETVREGIAFAINEEPDMNVVAEATDGEEAIAQALRFHPAVVIMDIAMPRMNGIKATERLRTELPQTRIIGLSMHEEDEMAQAMLDAGAAEYLSKRSGIETLLKTIRQQAGIA